MWRLDLAVVLMSGSQFFYSFKRSFIVISLVIVSELYRVLVFKEVWI